MRESTYNPPMSKIKMTGEQLRAARLRVRMDQALLGRIVGAHRTTVSDWERGASPVPQCVAVLARLITADPALCQRVLDMAEAGE